MIKRKMNRTQRRERRQKWLWNRHGVWHTLFCIFTGRRLMKIEHMDGDKKGKTVYTWISNKEWEKIKVQHLAPPPPHNSLGWLVGRLVSPPHYRRVSPP